MTALLLVCGLLAGLVLGLAVFTASGALLMVVDGCFKDCTFPLWPIVVAVCAPLAYVVVRDVLLARRGLAETRLFSLGWFARQSIPLSMALSMSSLGWGVLFGPVYVLSSIPLSG